MRKESGGSISKYEMKVEEKRQEMIESQDKHRKWRDGRILKIEKKTKKPQLAMNGKREQRCARNNSEDGKKEN